MPKSPPAFPGDIQHDLRDHMLDRRLETLSDWVGEASGIYLRAAGILRIRQHDALAISLDQDCRFDARTLWVSHDHMAAHWRKDYMPEVILKRENTLWPPAMLTNSVNSYQELMAIFQQWMRKQANIWADLFPDMLELFLLAVVGEHTRSGQSVEAELFHTLAHTYPVPDHAKAYRIG